MAEETTLVPVEEYLNSGAHIGTRFKNKYIEKYIFKSREDGLKVIDNSMIDYKLRNLANFMAYYDPSEIAVVGRRENAKEPIRVFGRLVGCDVFVSRFLPGTLTNTSLEKFKEYKLILISDPLTDKNILEEAYKEGVVIASLCDTNNLTSKIDYVVPVNNKGKKSLALVYYLLAKNYLIKKNLIKENEFNYKLEDFYEE